jgi:hypothetical protein
MMTTTSPRTIQVLSSATPAGSASRVTLWTILLRALSAAAA